MYPSGHNTRLCPCCHWCHRPGIIAVTCARTVTGAVAVAAAADVAGAVTGAGAVKAAPCFLLLDVVTAGTEADLNLVFGSSGTDTVACDPTV